MNTFKNAKANILGWDDLEQITRAAFENRVGTILTEAERIIPGEIDNNTSKIKSGNIKDPYSDDVLDDLAELVLEKKGEVVVLPKERMPSKTGLPLYIDINRFLLIERFDF